MDLLAGIKPSSQKLTPIAVKDETTPNDDFNALLVDSMNGAKTALPAATDNDKPAPETPAASEAPATPATDPNGSNILAMLTQVNAYQAATAGKDSPATLTDPSLNVSQRASPTVVIATAAASSPSLATTDIAKPAPQPSTEPCPPTLALDKLTTLLKTGRADATDAATATSVANEPSQALSPMSLAAYLKPVIDAPATAVAPASIITPFGKSGWTQAVAQQVLLMVKDKVQTISLALNPPNLGPLQVLVKIENQVANVQFYSAAPEVQQALRDGLPVLQELLGQAGVTLGQADIGHKQSQRGQKNNPAKPNESSAGWEEELIPATHNTQKDSSYRQGLVNLYA
jgi:flagellar hook-length control protein FliK